MFDNLINSSFKNIYNSAIDSLISKNGLGISCKLIYNSTKKSFCSNCKFDPILNKSANLYNGTGHAPFADYSICPVCNGFGIIELTPEETIYMALIFDSKYWLNWNSKTVNISNNMAQSICNISLLPKIQNAKEIILDSTIVNHGNRIYTRVNDPEVCGLGENRYIITMWQKNS